MFRWLMYLNLASEYCRGVDRAGERVQKRLHHDTPERWYVQAQCRSHVIVNISRITIPSFGADERGQSEERHRICVNSGKDDNVQVRPVTPDGARIT